LLPSMSPAIGTPDKYGRAVPNSVAPWLEAPSTMFPP
jgi:hypothetical protein